MVALENSLKYNSKFTVDYQTWLFFSCQVNSSETYVGMYKTRGVIRNKDIL